MNYRTATVLLLSAATLAATPGAGLRGGDLAPGLARQLATEGPEPLAKAARAQGDAVRGAVVFHRPELACTRCHTAGEEGARFGPDLALAGKDATDIYLVE